MQIAFEVVSLHLGLPREAHQAAIEQDAFPGQANPTPAGAKGVERLTIPSHALTLPHEPDALPFDVLDHRRAVVGCVMS